MPMSKTAIVPRVLALITAVARTPLWVTIASTVAALSLIAVALTVFSEGTTYEGLDSGRMAFSFVVLLALAFVLFATPAMTDRVRDLIGAKGVVDSLVIAFTVAGSLVVAAAPAGLWALLVTGVDASVWLAALGALIVEVLVVAILVGVGFGTIARTGVATAVAYGAISSLTVLPLLVLSTVAFMPGVDQRVTVTMIEWPEDGKGVDPVTGYPVDPVCKTKNVQTQTFPQYNLVWAAAPTVPFTFVSEAVEPAVVEFDADLYGSMSRSTAPVDLFSTLSIDSRGMQLPVVEDFAYSECDALEETGQPYIDFYSGPQPQTVIDSTESGFAVGLLGQGVISGAWVAGMLIVPKLRRRT
jgi:hypothetical protein